MGKSDKQRERKAIIVSHMAVWKLVKNGVRKWGMIMRKKDLVSWID